MRISSQGPCCVPLNEVPSWWWLGHRAPLTRRWCLEEVERFSRKQWVVRSDQSFRSMLKAIDELTWPSLTGLHRTPETEDACVDGLPSQLVVRLIAKFVSFTKRNKRVRPTFTVATLLLFGADSCLSLCAALQAGRAQVNERIQERNAVAATAEAK